MQYFSSSKVEIMQAEKGLTRRCNLSRSSKHALGNVPALSFKWNLFMQSKRENLETEPVRDERCDALFTIVYPTDVRRPDRYPDVWGIVFTVQPFLNQNAGRLDLGGDEKGLYFVKRCPRSLMQCMAVVYSAIPPSADLCSFAPCYKCLWFCVRSHVVSRLRFLIQSWDVSERCRCRLETMSSLKGTYYAKLTL